MLERTEAREAGLEERIHHQQQLAPLAPFPSLVSALKRARDYSLGPEPVQALLIPWLHRGLLVLKLTTDWSPWALEEVSEASDV